jgi:hypothetical protein
MATLAYSSMQIVRLLVEATIASAVAAVCIGGCGWMRPHLRLLLTL